MMPTVPKPIALTPFVLYQSNLLSTYAERVIHGFTGKPISLGGPGFAQEEIQANRQELCKQVGMNGAQLVVPQQKHTDQVRLNGTPCENAADAVILTEVDIPALVQVADCVPIILYEPEQHIGAVIHAGWRGTAQAITAKVASQLIDHHGAKPKRLIAIIGPSIGGCCYEVSTEVSEAVAETIPNQPSHLYQTMQANDKPKIDLKRVNQLQLQALGVEQIELIEACTQCSTDHLWSYRRNENGRQVAFLQLL